MQTKPVIVFALFGLSAVFSATAATITVNTYSDAVGNDGRCSLREAITAANTNTPSGTMAGECVAGETTLDTIVFDVMESCPITGCSISLQTGLPTITSPVSIVGPGSLAVERAAGNMRIFDVVTGNLGAATTISGLRIRNGNIPDVDGGAGVRNGFSLLNLTNCAFVNNVTNGTTGTRGGGGLLNVGGTVNVTNCTFTSCRALLGAAIYSTGTLTVAGSTFSGNTAGFTITSGQGGGILAGNFATTTMTDCTFTNNFAGERGGAIIARGTFTLTRCSLTGNKAGGNGGGVSNFGTCTIVDSTIAENMAGQVASGGFNGQGGGIANANGTLTVINSTISGNVTDSAGGGIRNDATLRLTNSTVTGNSTSNPTSTQGGGIDSTAGVGIPTASIKSSIVALNSAITGPDFVGNVSSSGFNLIGKGDGSTGFTAPTDQGGTIAAPLDPMLDPAGLQNNGGPTTTIALLIGSPAIDKGTSNGLTGNLTTDQRGTGFLRAFDDPTTPNATGGDGADVGAFELQPAPATLANISTRLRVLSGDNALIGGMIATGTAGKRVIIRAVGPSLIPFGIPGALANPTLDLFQGSTLLFSNDDWQNSPQQTDIANSGLAPSNNLESAIIQTLTPGQNYTAVVRGQNGGTGVGIVEAYDLDQAAASKLGNISTRGFVDVDDNVMIAGLIVGPGNGTSLKVLVRALGPTLSDFGVPGALANPTLDLVNSSGTVIRSNNNWKDDPQQRAAIEAAGLAPSHDEESALVETVPPGAYTAIVRGSGRTTGVGLVEAYNIP